MDESDLPWIIVILTPIVIILWLWLSTKRREEEEAKKRNAKISVLEGKIAQAQASFLEQYEDFDEDDSKDAKKALSQSGVELSALYHQLAGYYAFKPSSKYGHLESSYRTLLKALSVLPTRTKVRVQALERGRELAEYGRTLQGSNRITIYDEAAIQNDLEAHGG